MTVQYSQVPFLPTALRIEGGLVQHDAAVVNDDYLGLELGQFGVLVIKHPGVRHALREVLLLDRLCLRFLMLLRHLHVEVVRDIDLVRGKLLGYLRVESVRVIELDQLIYGELLPWLQLLGEAGDQRFTASQRLVITPFLDLDQVHDVVAIGIQLREYGAEIVDLLAHHISEPNVDAEGANGTECAADEHSGEISFPDVRRDDTVVQQHHQCTRMVTDDVDVLQR